MRNRIIPLIIIFILLFPLLKSIVFASASNGWEVTTESDDSSCSDKVDNDGDAYIDWSDYSCRSLVWGYVKDKYGNPVYNASVEVLGPDNEIDFTDSLGYYELYAIPHTNPLGNGNYNYFFAVNKTHKSNTVDERDIEPGGITYLQNHSVNFTMFENKNVCESDCTYNTDSLCHVECLGLNGCTNSNLYNTLGLCGSVDNPYQAGTVLSINSTHKVVCCNGDPYRFQSEKIDNSDLNKVNINLENIKHTERVVFVNGQTYKIHVVVFNK